jgi:hypothetical protein
MPRNFGLEGNGKLCSCGRHEGIGEFTPEQRAASSAFARDRIPEYMTGPQKMYLADWELHHGRVQWRMGVVCRYKRKDVIGAIYVDPHAPMELPFGNDKYKDRVDLNG